MGNFIGSNYSNFNIGNLMAKGEAALEKAGQTAKSMTAKTLSKAEQLANKITKFDDNDLKNLAKKLEKYSDKAVAEMKKVAISTIHKLDEVTGGAVKGFCKDMNLPYPQKSTSGQAKDFSKEFFGKETYNGFSKFGNEIKRNFNKFISEVNADPEISKAKSAASKAATDFKNIFSRA